CKKQRPVEQQVVRVLADVAEAIHDEAVPTRMRFHRPSRIGAIRRWKSVLLRPTLHLRDDTAMETIRDRTRDQRAVIPHVSSEEDDPASWAQDASQLGEH